MTVSVSHYLLVIRLLDLECASLCLRYFVVIISATK